MPFVAAGGATLHYGLSQGQGRPIVFLNALGTDMRLWDGVLMELRPSCPVLTMDKRGHGLSDAAPITMDRLVQDVIDVMDHLDLSQAILCGVSVGGMIAQGVALARPDLVAGLVLLCTGARIGDETIWNARIEAIMAQGIDASAEPILARWFSTRFRASHPAAVSGYRNMLTRTTQAGYCDICAAIRDTDLTARSVCIQCPTLCLAGSEDIVTRPEHMEHLASLIPGAEYHLLSGPGHLPCVESPHMVAHHLGQLQEKVQ